MAAVADILSGGAQWEQGLANLGMGAPTGRFVAGMLAGSVVMWALRPDIAYNSDGSAKQWEIWSDGRSPATATPWWALAAVPGVIFATFF